KPEVATPERGTPDRERTHRTDVIEIGGRAILKAPTDVAASRSVEEQDRPGPLASDREVIDKLVGEANETLSSVTSLRFNIDRESRSFSVSVIDKSNNEVVRQIPSEDMQTLARRMRELQGILFDEMA
ncbi:MAG: flagellar protein FlaG, partial [Magnetococcales bacterium]|nr:flagellar protein FlaG [Magnetococcales bacterium]